MNHLAQTTAWLQLVEALAEELFPRRRKVPKQQNPIMIGENDSDEILTMVYS
jgi:hypothetical protein